jgi:uncharacterized protein
MNCPNCQTTFQEVQVKSRYGANIKINQCPNCGGIWCNSLDMSSIAPEEAEKIDELDIKKLAESSPINKKLSCPQCHGELQHFKDENFPDQIKISFCPKCMAFWLNRGELAEFKEWQEVKINKARSDKELKEQINSVLAGASDGTYEGLGFLGNLMNQQVAYGPMDGGASVDIIVDTLKKLFGCL